MGGKVDDQKMIKIPNKGDLYQCDGKTFFCYESKNEFGNKGAQAVLIESIIMKRSEQLKQDADRLNHILIGNAQLSVAYPILARHGFMDRTANGYKCIGPDIVIRRCREALNKIEGEVLEDISDA